MLPKLPKQGSPIESFLQWENATISALGDSSEHDSVWSSWCAAEGLCLTAKEKRFEHFNSAKVSLEQQGLELAVRRSGGTTVPHGAGILAISHIAKSIGPKEIKRSYLEFCQEIQNVLKQLGFDTHVGPAAGAYCDGDYNVLINDLKLVGTSQRWTRAGKSRTEIVLNHAVMLVTADSAEVTARVNTFHRLAENRTPFDERASTSLWESKPTSPPNMENREEFFKSIADAFQAHQ